MSIIDISILITGIIFLILECNCNEENAMDEICDLMTGQCSCKPFFNSTDGCGACISGYWGTDSCEPCNCCTNGSSESKECDQVRILSVYSIELLLFYV